MTAAQLTRLLAAIVLALLAFMPLPSMSAEHGPAVAGRHEADESGRRRENDGREDESRRDEANRPEATSRAEVEAAGRKADLTERRNPDFHDADKLAADIRADRGAEADFTKVESQLERRGWTEQQARDLLRTEPVGTSVDGRDGRNDPASVYGKPREYIVLNDRTKEVVQVSDRKDPTWNDDSRIHWREGSDANQSR